MLAARSSQAHEGRRTVWGVGSLNAICINREHRHPPAVSHTHESLRDLSSLSMLSERVKLVKVLGSEILISYSMHYFQCDTFHSSPKAQRAQ